MLKRNVSVLQGFVFTTGRPEITCRLSPAVTCSQLESTFDPFSSHEGVAQSRLTVASKLWWFARPPGSCLFAGIVCAEAGRAPASRPRSRAGGEHWRPASAHGVARRERGMSRGRANRWEDAERFEPGLRSRTPFARPLPRRHPGHLEPALIAQVVLGAPSFTEGVLILAPVASRLEYFVAPRWAISRFRRSRQDRLAPDSRSQ